MLSRRGESLLLRQGAGEPTAEAVGDVPSTAPCCRPGLTWVLRRRVPERGEEDRA